MDYLVVEGYKAAAEEFSKEANIMPPMDLESIESRMNIRDALHRGAVEDAIAQVNDLDPEVSDKPSLDFSRSVLRSIRLAMADMDWTTA